MSADEFNAIKDRLIAATGSPGLTSFHGGKVHMTLSEWNRLVTLIETVAAHEAAIRADQIAKDAEIAEEVPSDWAMTYREFAADTIARAIARAIRAQSSSPREVTDDGPWEYDKEWGVRRRPAVPAGPWEPVPATTEGEKRA